jgi:hypothetical protein
MIPMPFAGQCVIVQPTRTLGAYCAVARLRRSHLAVSAGGVDLVLLEDAVGVAGLAVLGSERLRYG